MKYVLLMGRGIEGTGNTKYAVELQEFIETNGHDCVTIANSDKKWGREKSHPNKIKLLGFADHEDLIVETCIKSDVVIVLSVPAKNYDWFSQDSFYNIITRVEEHNQTKLVYIQVDHKRQSITRNFYADLAYVDILEKFDCVITHSDKSDFVDFCVNNGVQLNRLICSSNLSAGINGLNFEKYKSFWTNEKDYKTIRFIGRSAVWKGPWMVRDLHTSHFRDRGYVTLLEGIEGSIGTVAELYKETKPNRIPRDDVLIKLRTEDKRRLDNDEMALERDMPVYILPPYDNTKAMHRLARSTFGIELLFLDDRILSDICEYAMMEIVAVGTIPIFRKKWGEKFKINGKPIIEYDTGIIFMDEKSPDAALERMEKLANDKHEYEYTRNKVFDFFKTHFSSNVIFKQLLEAINE